jgi:hypothetical protein
MEPSIRQLPQCFRDTGQQLEFGQAVRRVGDAVADDAAIQDAIAIEEDGRREEE